MNIEEWINRPCTSVCPCITCQLARLSERQRARIAELQAEIERLKGAV